MVLQHQIVRSNGQKVLQWITCKTLSYEVFELINSSSICFNMLNATYNDHDVGVVDVDNGVWSINLLSSMIDKGNVTRNDQNHYFIEPSYSGAPCWSIDAIINLYKYI